MNKKTKEEILKEYIEEHFKKKDILKESQFDHYKDLSERDIEI